MTFVKGVSGNPSGKPKANPLIKEMFSRRLETAMAAVDACLKHKNYALRLKAAELIFERVLGKPSQAVELSGSLESITVNVIRKEK